jgi:broad specificity phosphatase PhoE
MSNIYLIRHGQASFGAADYDALSPLGFEQARVLGERLALRLRDDVRPLHAFAGNMRRHRETAATCLAALAHAGEPAIDAGFNEYDHEQVIDCYEPRYRDRALMQAELRQAADPRRAFQQMFESAVARWTGGEYDADYRESWPVFRARCQAALRQVIEATPRDGTALVFTSGGTITALCQGIMDLSNGAAFRLNWTLANAGLTKLRAGAGGVHLITLNEQSQFEGEHAALLTYR